MPAAGQLRTVLGELGGGELCGNPEGLFHAALENEAGGDVGTAVEVLLTAGQPQVEGVVTEGRVFITLRTRDTEKEENKEGKSDSNRSVHLIDKV